jgi:ATP-dependent helicase/nuclease subunit A
MASNYETTGPKDLHRFLEFLDACENRGLSTNGSQQEKGAVSIMSIHKSKGLEFPVVFLCGLSRSFNQESSRAQVLCHKDLGIGLDCTDTKLRVRYPTIAKRAVSTMIQRESISEELRVLYVALTRAKDRLYMTYAARNLAGNLQEISTRLDMCSSELLASEADCPGWWVLQSALTRTEAGALFALSYHPNCAQVRDSQWQIKVAIPNNHCANFELVASENTVLSDKMQRDFSDALNFVYPHANATLIPSKLTATELKGRTLDMEISEGTEAIREISFRKAGSTSQLSGTAYGSAVHAVLQNICFSACDSLEGIRMEIFRLEKEHLITSEQASAVDINALFAFFKLPLGKKICKSKNVIREFKFSVLCDASQYYPDSTDDKILLQGVVDLALIEDDGITVLDFKTDRATGNSLHILTEKYKPQVRAYVNALTRIYQKPIKSAMLYFFSLNQLVDVL